MIYTPIARLPSGAHVRVLARPRSAVWHSSRA